MRTVAIQRLPCVVARMAIQTGRTNAPNASMGGVAADAVAELTEEGGGDECWRGRPYLFMVPAAARE